MNYPPLNARRLKSELPASLSIAALCRSISSLTRSPQALGSRSSCGTVYPSGCRTKSKDPQSFVFDIHCSIVIPVDSEIALRAVVDPI